MISGYVKSHDGIKQLSKEQQLLLHKIFVSLVQASNPQDHLQQVGELMACCSALLSDDQGREKKIARIANKALEMILNAK